MLGVTPSTVTRWAKLGLIPTAVTIGGHHRYYRSEIVKMAAELAVGKLPPGYREEQVGRDEATPRRRSIPAEALSAVHAARPGHSGNGAGALVEIRWHGRGGQGVVTASQILAEAALLEEHYFQAFPEFGPERTGAPLRAYTRIGRAPINLHCPISEPDIVVVLDPTLLATVDVLDGLKESGTLVINTPLEPQALRAKLARSRAFKVVTIDATRIAMDSFKRNVPNTPILGALLRVAPVVSTESCLRLLKERLGARLDTAVVEANVKAFQQAYAEAREG